MDIRNIAWASTVPLKVPATPAPQAVALFGRLAQPGAAGAARGTDADASMVGMGQAMLREVDGLRGRIAADWGAVEQLGANGTPSAVELLQAQLKMVGATFQSDLVSKVVSKSEQDIEQLVKMQ